MASGQITKENHSGGKKSLMHIKNLYLDTRYLESTIT